MKWKQFLTPVASLTGPEAKEMANTAKPGEVLFLDVRQPKEYKNSHLPGAKLIPVNELDQRLDELDPNRPTVVYCAIGGRSRVATQLLAGRGFDQVYNLSGGIKAWEHETAVGTQEHGMELFSGNESAEESIITAFGLEEGLREFYLTMKAKVHDHDAKELFAKLAGIEILHQERLVTLYREMSGKNITSEDFFKTMVVPALEGGMTTDEYLQLYQPDLESIVEILSLAMSIEAQALDLYQRAADNAEQEETAAVLQQIANEERAHMRQLAAYMDKVG